MAIGHVWGNEQCVCFCVSILVFAVGECPMCPKCLWRASIGPPGGGKTAGETTRFCRKALQRRTIAFNVDNNTSKNSQWSLSSSWLWNGAKQKNRSFDQTGSQPFVRLFVRVLNVWQCHKTADGCPDDGVVRGGGSDGGDVWMWAWVRASIAGQGTFTANLPRDGVCCCCYRYSVSCACKWPRPAWYLQRSQR